VIGQLGQRRLQVHQESRVRQVGRQDSLQVSDPRSLIGQVVRGGALSLVSQASVVFRCSSRIQSSSSWAPGFFSGQ
jgi:hypothetical protein